jgi:indolepyruvate ferredoxin oxidoreductase
VRIAAGEARLVLGADLIVAASDEAIAKMQTGHTRAVINADVTPTGDFSAKPDLQVPVAAMADSIRDATGPDAAEFIDAASIATALLGDSIATNLFLVGFAWQRGLLPVAAESIREAIRLNGAAVESNLAAFEWGRRTAHDEDMVKRLAKPAGTLPDSQRLSADLDERIARRKAYLTQYQDAAYAARYTDRVAKVRAAEAQKAPGSTTLTEAVARYLFKLMAYKDEYEVARLHADTGFRERIAQQFEGDFTVKYHLAPPLLAKNDPVTGEPRKREYGAWMGSVFGVLAKFKFLRGSAFDVFGYTAERRMERDLIRAYEKTLDEVVAKLDAKNLALAVDIASVPEHIRGFGPIKVRNVTDARAREAEYLRQFRDPGALPPRSVTIPIREAA